MAYNHIDYKKKLKEMKTLLEDMSYDIARMEFECGPGGMTERQNWAVASLEKSMPAFQARLDDVKGIIKETLDTSVKA